MASMVLRSMADMQHTDSPSRPPRPPTATATAESMQRPTPTTTRSALPPRTPWGPCKYETSGRGSSVRHGWTDEKRRSNFSKQQEVPQDGREVYKMAGGIHSRIPHRGPTDRLLWGGEEKRQKEKQKDERRPVIIKHFIFLYFCHVCIKAYKYIYVQICLFMFSGEFRTGGGGLTCASSASSSSSSYFTSFLPVDAVVMSLPAGSSPHALPAGLQRPLGGCSTAEDWKICRHPSPSAGAWRRTPGLPGGHLDWRRPRVVQGHVYTYAPGSSSAAFDRTSISEQLRHLPLHRGGRPACSAPLGAICSPLSLTTTHHNAPTSFT